MSSTNSSRGASEISVESDATSSSTQSIGGKIRIGAKSLVRKGKYGMKKVEDGIGSLYKNQGHELNYADPARRTCIQSTPLPVFFC
mmetsp:Transcript_12411/g.27111  ORF Transcript_12411/g.27111 Transcript_12411/m.27111 type:complete len:86 (-) Transcript_12411:177-434(-)|eukprot:CAMPEP_0185845614 /NCGR_PEP_ID=MMETSP1354-20130828/1527_1 /TAXON_ID=708628 /ORGANISM="Erythrolobus madagascarensis, Strain CCMP3276" /LENGTH=85 /DNA_ID=CAMNT_0028545609 /DNA_START=36 /DNA_END=293 /DNA_ORIENTATION=-